MSITKSEQPVDNPSNRPALTRSTTTLKGKTPRILGIDPGTRLMGVAVLDGDELLYYAVKELRRMRPTYQLVRATRDVVTKLIERYRPDVLAYEEIFYVQQSGSPLLQSAQREICRVGRASGLRVFGYSPLYVRDLLASDPYATKQTIANLLVGRFPELTGYRHGHSWRSERYWLNMFDAVAIAVVAGREAGAGGEASGARGARAA